MQLIQKARERFGKWRWREKLVHKGKENQDKTFFIIRRPSRQIGLFSFVCTHLGWIEYALQKGYIPIVDMQSYETLYLKKNRVGKENAWEYFYQQPCKYTLKDIKKSHNILYCDGTTVPADFVGGQILTDQEELLKWRELTHRYMRIRPQVHEHIREVYRELFPDRERVLGVICRGTDYTAIKPSQHPVQAEVADVIAKAVEMKQANNCELVYLATEDETVLEEFRKQFGDQLRYLSAKRYKDLGGRYLNDVKEIWSENGYKLGLDYLATVAILARCNCFLSGGGNGGTYGALIMSDGFEDSFVFDLGFYH